MSNFFTKIFVCGCWALLFSQQIIAQNKLYENVTLQKIIDFQDRRQIDSLALILAHGTTEEKTRAMLAFGSIQDPQTISLLAPFLKHENAELRQATAFSLGQLGSKEIGALLVEVALIEKDDVTQASILEALGKSATPEVLNYLADYQCSNQINCTGQAKGLYRAVTWQRLINAKALRKMMSLLDCQASTARLFAANALARSPQKNFDSTQIAFLVQKLDTEKDEFVRMNIATALNSSLQKNVEEKLLEVAKKDESELVRINAVRALAKFDTASLQKKVAALLYDKHPLVALVVSEHLRSHAKKDDGIDYLDWAEFTRQPQARANLLAAAVRWDKKGKVSSIVKKYFKKTDNVYEQGFLLNALAENPQNFEFIVEKINLQHKTPLNTFAFDALMVLLNQENFKTYAQKTAVENKVFELLTKTFTEGKDVVLMGLAAAELRNPQRNYRQKIQSIDFLKNVLPTLPLPLEIEAYLDIQKTIQFFEGTVETPPSALSFNHPIPQEKLKKLTDNPIVTIKTNKGNIVIELLPAVAPGSVLNFLELVEKGYFQQKRWHRVVPNFVIQSGCPRGDGYGNVDFSIRSEFMPVGYGEGYVGMASAGKDTEGSQFFITHSPTPHLDGRYTVFGRVIKGMDVVRKIEVGDFSVISYQ
jgi:cyclophilin family peptidyl-prolyl cis-trans isomerase/HEAT repeat protein